MKLDATNEIEWKTKDTFAGIETSTVYFGAGSTSSAMQIATGRAPSLPSRGTMKALFFDRKGRNSTSNLMVVIEFGEDCAIFGPDPDSELLVQKVGNARNFLNSVLAQESGTYQYHRAISIRRSLQTTDMVGFTNNGLFASHYIRTSASSHPKWQEAQERSASLQNLRDRELITSLGFEVTASPSNTLLLSAQGQDKRVVAILLGQSEHFDSNSPRFQGSPVEWGLDIAQQQGAPWVIAVRDSQIRLYPAKDGVGIGQKSQVETYFEIDLLTIDEDKIGLINLVFSAEALSDGGTADELLSNSQKFASELGVRLRERVYESIVPALATEIANQLRTKGFELDAKGLQRAYELTLRVLFRLLFQAYAEDRGLLPSGRNEIFDSNSMKHWADHLLKRDDALAFGDSSSIWFDMMQVWDAIDQGNPDMQIPAYNGGLFGTDQELHPDGHLIRSLSIPDRVMGPALRALVIDDNTEDGVAGAVDFRSLSVREFGTIYEGLLESSLSVADQDLTVDKKGAWVPAKGGDHVIAKANEVYFHSASGERKATGSYYTPSFIVDHLIERSVEPALNDHLAKVKLKLEADDQAGAYADFFDFRVADLAMGSAHFLVAAIDKIETVMRSFLIQEGNQIDGVNLELGRLRRAAEEALGTDEAAYAEIERSSLLRRQIARRCIYGLDINPLAVELSRLAIWIHTFVPGLPMSSLEHNLVCANSLTGIGSVEEGLNALVPERSKLNATTLFDDIVESSLSEAKSLLEDVANADEASKAEAKQAAQGARLARQAAAKSKLIFDVAVGNRNGVVSSGAALDQADLAELASNEKLIEFLDQLTPAHMPYLFPEVFLRPNPGFNALIGNPPWEELVIDKTRFWASKVPGLLALPVQERDLQIKALEMSRPDGFREYTSRLRSLESARSVLQSKFPLGVGDADLYKAFCWGALQLLTSDGGRLALALPKTAFSAAGMEHWRRALQDQGSLSTLTYLVNSGQWVFNIHPQYSVALMTYVKGGSSDLKVAGPVHSRADFDKLEQLPSVVIDRSVLLSFTESASIPSVVDQLTADILTKMRQTPSLADYSGGKFRAVREFDATIDRRLFDHNESGVGLPVLSGKSFNIWNSETGEVFAWADPEIVLAELERKMERQLRIRSSAFYGLSFEKDFGGQHPISRPRIAFRGVTRPTDSRTFIPALLAPNQVLTNIAPYLLSPVGSAKQEAYLLGVMSSLPFDWYARKFIETAVNFHLLNAFPIPSGVPAGLEARIVEVSGILASVDHRFEAWAKEVGVDVASVTSTLQKSELIGELDGLVAAAYGLSMSDLEHIFTTFHRGWSDQTRLRQAQEALQNWGEAQ